MTVARVRGALLAVLVAAVGVVPALTDAGPLARARGWLADGTAAVAAVSLPTVGVAVRRDGRVLSTEDGRRVRVARECDALAPLAVLVAALLLAAGDPRRRLVAGAVGLLVLFGANQLRIAHLVTLAARDPAAFRRAHEVAWPVVLGLLAVVVVALGTRHASVRP